MHVTERRLSNIAIIVPILFLGCSGGVESSPTDGDADPVEQVLADAGLPDARPADGDDRSDGGERVDSGVDGGTDAGRPAPAELRILGQNPKVVYRYRTYRTDYGGGRAEYISAGTPQNLTLTRDADVTVYDRGSVLDDLWVTSFNGIEQYDRAAEEVPAQQPDIGLTLHTWFRPDAGNARMTIFSNRPAVDDTGLSVQVIEGALRATLGVDDSSTGSLQVEHPIEPGRWHEVAVQVTATADGVRLRLYLDSELVSESAVPGATLRASTQPPLVGAALDSAGVATDFFAGELYAVELRNWPVHHDVLTVAWLRDGGRYLGRPSFHDTLQGGAFTDPTQECAGIQVPRTDVLLRMEDTLAEYPHVAGAARLFGTPLVNEEYTPQGLSVADDGNTLWLSSYASAASGEGDHKATVLQEVSIEERRVTGVYRMVTTGGADVTHHAGGIAARGNGEATVLYVANSRADSIERYRIADRVLEVAGTDNQPAVYRISAASSYPVGINPSFVDIDAEGALWVGAHDGSAVDAPLHGYALEPGGEVGAAPFATFALPVSRVQGVAAYYEPGGERAFLITRSLGDNTSDVLRWDGASAAVAVAYLPAGVEDIDVLGDSVWTWSESGAGYYQKRCTASRVGWQDFAPFVFEFELDTLRQGLNNVLPGRLAFNEILADPASTVADGGDANCDGIRDSEQDEFVEILNGSRDEIDLNGATIADEYGVRHTFAPNTVLRPGGVAVVFGGGMPFTEATDPWCTALPVGVLVEVADDGLLGLTNTGDTLTLTASDGTLLARRQLRERNDSAGNDIDESVSRTPDGWGGFARHPGAHPQSPGRRVDGGEF